MSRASTLIQKAVTQYANQLKPTYRGPGQDAYDLCIITKLSYQPAQGCRYRWRTNPW